MPATKITWRDVLEMPEDGNRYEAIGGELYVSPPPKNRHQWIGANLFSALAAGAAEPERYTDTLPVRLGDVLVGEIPLSTIFDWPR